MMCGDRTDCLPPKRRVRRRSRSAPVGEERMTSDFRSVNYGEDLSSDHSDPGPSSTSRRVASTSRPRIPRASSVRRYRPRNALFRKIMSRSTASEVLRTPSKPINSYFVLVSGLRPRPVIADRGSSVISAPVSIRSRKSRTRRMLRHFRVMICFRKSAAVEESANRGLQRWEVRVTDLRVVATERSLAIRSIQAFTSASSSALR